MDLFSLEDFVSHLPRYESSSLLITRDQEPQWAECPAPKESMLHRHMANCLKDKNSWSIDMWKSPTHPIHRFNNLRIHTQ